MSDVPPPRAPGPPDWVGEAWRSARDELRHFAATAYAFTRHPVDFAKRWRSGESDAMNPIAFLGTSAVFVGAMRQLALRALGRQAPDSILAAIADALGPYLHYAALALICHVALRAGSRRRARAVDSVAFALYAGGGPAAVAECAVWAVVLVASPFVPASAAPWLVGIGLGAAFSVFCAALSTGLAILHDAGHWRMLLAFVLAFPLLGLFFGLVSPPGHYGMHWVVTLWGPHGQLAPRLGLGL